MAKINAINNKSNKLIIDPGSAGDSFVQYSINGTGEFRIGVDDTASDAFKISQGSILGATDTLVMTASGECTIPLNPCFSANITAGQNNVTGDGTAYKVLFGGEYFDVNGDFAASTFIAPVTAKYFFSSTFQYTGILGTHTSSELNLVTTARTYKFDVFNPYIISSGSLVMPRLALFVDMTAADTAYVQLKVSNGTKVIDIIAYGFFNGYLIN